VASFCIFSSGFGGHAGFATTTSNDPPAPKDKGHVLTKTDLVQILAAEHDLKMAESNRILDTLLDTIMEVRALLYEINVYFYFFLPFVVHASCATCYFATHHTGSFQRGRSINLWLWEIYQQSS
jgi:hypothetical protein